MICSGVSVRCDSVEGEGLGWPDFGVSRRTLQSAVDDAVLKLSVREKADEAHVWYRGLSLVVAERLRPKQHICAECRSLDIRNVQSWRAWRASGLHSGVGEGLRVCCQRATLNETIRRIRKVAQHIAGLNARSRILGGVLQTVAARDGTSNAMPPQLLRHRKSDVQLDSREVVDGVPSQRRLMVRAPGVKMAHTPGDINAACALSIHRYTIVFLPLHSSAAIADARGTNLYRYLR